MLENKIIPFPTEYRDDPTLAAGHTATIQARPQRSLARVLESRQQGRRRSCSGPWSGEEVVQPPVTQILRRGTKASGHPAAAGGAARSASGRVLQSGSASWYDSHAGSGSCAHLTLPFGTIVKIAASNGRTAAVPRRRPGPEGVDRPHHRPEPRRVRSSSRRSAPA